MNPVAQSEHLEEIVDRLENLLLAVIIFALVAVVEWELQEATDFLA